MEDSNSRALTAAALNRILDICRGNPEGISDKALGEQMHDVPLAARAQAINILLQKHQLQIFKHEDTLMYKEQSREEAGKLKGLQPEDLLVYQVIQGAKNDGIWTRDMKRETNLQQPQIAKAIKNLEARKLIKAVQCVNNKTKKVYMLAELKPSEKVTGGAWYSGQEFDAEFVNVLKEQCLQYVLKEGIVTLEHIANFVRKSGLTKEELHTKNFKQIMDMLVLDGDIEEAVSTGTGAFISIPPDTLCFKASPNRIPETSAFTNIPCGICPVLHQCTENGLISPKTCVYFQEWLKF